MNEENKTNEERILKFAELDRKKETKAEKFINDAFMYVKGAIIIGVGIIVLVSLYKIAF